MVVVVLVVVEVVDEVDEVNESRTITTINKHCWSIITFHYTFYMKRIRLIYMRIGADSSLQITTDTIIRDPCTVRVFVALNLAVRERVADLCIARVETGQIVTGAVSCQLGVACGCWVRRKYNADKESQRKSHTSFCGGSGSTTS